jgi:glycosyltransferase involved in cell wall biosynthesis
MHVCIVVPCYNEERRLDGDTFVSFVAEAQRADLTVDLLFVNDGSTDATGEVLETLTSRIGDRASWLQLSENRGKSGAVRAGLQHVLDHMPDCEFMGYWDADLATPLDEIPAFMTYFQQRPDVLAVLGSRVQLLGRHIERQAIRHYLGRVFATAASAVLALPVYDTQCGAKIFRRHPVLTAALQTPFLSRWAFDVELLARMGDACADNGLRSLVDVVVEHPLQTWCDKAGTKVKPWDFPVALVQLGRIAMRTRVP